MPGGAGDSAFDLPMMPRTWPRNVGVISIIWGALGLLCNSCGLLGQVFQNMAAGMVPPGANGQQMPPMPDVMKSTIGEMGLMGIGFVTSVVLIIGGSLLVARKPIARPLHLLYAAVSIVLTITYAVVAMQKQAAILEWAKQNPDNMWAKQQNMAGDFAYLIVGVLSLLGLVYPGFCLIWFGFVKRNTQEITEGYEEPLL